MKEEKQLHADKRYQFKYPSHSLHENSQQFNQTPAEIARQKSLKKDGLQQIKQQQVSQCQVGMSPMRNRNHQFNSASSANYQLKTSVRNECDLILTEESVDQCLDRRIQSFSTHKVASAQRYFNQFSLGLNQSQHPQIPSAEIHQIHSSNLSEEEVQPLDKAENQVRECFYQDCSSSNADEDIVLSPPQKNYRHIQQNQFFLGRNVLGSYSKLEESSYVQEQDQKDKYNCNFNRIKPSAMDNYYENKNNNMLRRNIIRLNSEDIHEGSSLDPVSLKEPKQNCHNNSALVVASGLNYQLSLYASSQQVVGISKTDTGQNYQEEEEENENESKKEEESQQHEYQSNKMLSTKGKQHSLVQQIKQQFEETQRNEENCQIIQADKSTSQRITQNLVFNNNPLGLNHADSKDGVTPKLVDVDDIAIKDIKFIKTTPGGSVLEQIISTAKFGNAPREFDFQESSIQITNNNHNNNNNNPSHGSHLQSNLTYCTTGQLFNQTTQEFEKQHSQNENNSPNISTLLRNAETDDIRSYPLTPNDEMQLDRIHQFFMLHPLLIKALFTRDLVQLKKLLETLGNQVKNTKDALGNTLLFIATKLSIQNDEFYHIFKYLLQIGADPRIRNELEYSPLDEAVKARNVKLTTTLFEYLYQSKKRKLSDSLGKLSSLLLVMPDCYIEIKWHFESVIPFLGYFAPSDTFIFWKIGDSFRLDTTLVGVTNLKCKRRNMSLIFRNGKLTLVNKSNKTITDPSEPLDFQEKKKIIEDLLESKPFLNTVEVVSCNVNPVKSVWNGNPLKKRLGQYQSLQFQMKIGYEYKTRKSTNSIGSNANNPSNSNNMDDVKMFASSEAYLALHDSKEENYNLKAERNSKEWSKSKEKKVICNLWMSKEYPITLKQFLPVLAVLERSNPMLQKLNEFLVKPEVKNLLSEEGFPVKIQIPLSFTLKSTVDFSDFKFITPTPEELEKILFIDSSFSILPRNVAQKTLTRTKKRMVLANMITA